MDKTGAEALYRKVLESRERLLGPTHPDTLHSVRNLGNLLKQKGDLTEAEALHRKVLEAREKLLGPEHPDTLISMNELGILLSMKNDLSEAETQFRGCSRGVKDS